jgi:hypothetical protein
VQISGQIVNSTRWIVPAAKITLLFAMGVVSGGVGFWIALFAAVAVPAVKIYMFYDLNREQVRAAAGHLGTAATLLRWYAEHCPVTHRQFVRLLGAASWEALSSVPQGISGEDAAITFGKLLGGLSAGPDLGIRSFLRAVRSAVATFTMRVPAMAARGGAARARVAADELIHQFNQRGIQLTGADANEIRREFQRHPEAAEKLEQLQQSLEGFMPVLEGLAESLQLESEVPTLSPAASATTSP